MNKLLFMYFTLIYFFIFVVSFSGNVGSFAYPTSHKAIDIVRHGTFGSISNFNITTFWVESLRVEEWYPVPSLILGIIALIINIDLNLLPFLPISGIVMFLFSYLLFKRLWYERLGNTRIYSIFLLVLPVYDIITRNTGFYIGRAALGTALIVVGMYLILRIFDKYENERTKYIIVFLIFYIATYFTYYTATLAIAFALFTLFLALKLRLMKNISNKNSTNLLYLTIYTFTFVLLQPIISSLIISPSNIFHHLLYAILVRLGLEQGDQPFMRMIPIDPLVTMVSTMISPVTKAIIYIVFVYYLASRIISKNLTINNIYDIFGFLIIGISLSEVFYLSYASILPLRLFTIFTVFYLPILFVVISQKYFRLLLYPVIVLFVILYIGHVYYALFYGPMLTLERAVGIISYMSSSNDSNIIVIGDEIYTGYLFFKTHIYNYTYHFTTFHRYIYKLFSSAHEVIDETLTYFRARGIRYLLFPSDKRPICGDAWGYCVIPDEGILGYMRALYSFIYSDKFFILIKI